MTEEKISRANVYMIEPEKLKIITDQENVLYDSRTELAVSENLVKNIMVHGIIENVIVRNIDGAYTVLAGRQRVKAAIEANKRLGKEGKELIKVPCTIRREDDIDSFGILISENELRQGDSPIDKAKKCAKYMNMGRTDKDAAIQFGVSVQTITSWMKILELSAPVKKAIDDGIIDATAAAELHGLKAEEQKTQLDKLIAEHGGKKKKISQTKVKKAIGKGNKIARSYKEIRGAADASHIEAEKDALLWVLGENETL